MHMLLYFLAFATAIMGMALGVWNGAIDLIATGLLAAVLFGALGKVVHFLEKIDAHLGLLREERRNSPTRLALVPEEYMFSKGQIHPDRPDDAPGPEERQH